MKRYTIEFESSHGQWMVIDTKGPDAELGYHYDKADARGVSDMLNQRIELLAALEEMADEVEDMLRKAGVGSPAATVLRWSAKRLNKAKAAIAKTNGGE